MKKISTGVKVVIAFFCGIVFLYVYASCKENMASAAALEFCGGTEIGQSWDVLSKRVKNSGADLKQSRLIKAGVTASWIPVTFIGATPISRYTCSISLENKKVVDMKVRYID